MLTTRRDVGGKEPAGRSTQVKSKNHPGARRDAVRRKQPVLRHTAQRGLSVKLRHWDAVRYEGVLRAGRTHPLILGSRQRGQVSNAEPKVVKAIGCPEVASQRQLVAEIIGNAIARRMGVQTPEPCIVHISETVALSVNASLRSEGLAHQVLAGPAAGCEKVLLVPYTLGQHLNPEQQTQAARLYVFDMLSQNSDRRAAKVNCAMGAAGVVAFDFETCFPHLFIPIIGGLGGEHWEPSKSIQGREHLFYRVARDHPLPEEAVEAAAEALTAEWWQDLLESLPDEWRSDANEIGSAVRAVAEHRKEFARDITWSLS